MMEETCGHGCARSETCAQRQARCAQVSDTRTDPTEDI